nr:MAG TPA_asm: hypothetical protein [Caudoviricetes sp.]
MQKISARWGAASIYALLAYIQLHTFKRPLCVICLSA